MTIIHLEFNPSIPVPKELSFKEAIPAHSHVGGEVLLKSLGNSHLLSIIDQLQLNNPGIRIVDENKEDFVKKENLFTDEILYIVLTGDGLLSLLGLLTESE